MRTNAWVYIGAVLESLVGDVFKLACSAGNGRLMITNDCMQNVINSIKVAAPLTIIEDGTLFSEFTEVDPIIPVPAPIEKLELMKKLGKGGQSTVYRATYTDKEGSVSDVVSKIPRRSNYYRNLMVLLNEHSIYNKTKDARGIIKCFGLVNTIKQIT